MQVSLISSTVGENGETAEALMAYCARVSNPDNQNNPDYSKLFAYCIKNGHWSVFEQATLTFEIVTSRAISRQILRHDMHFQEFSQRYAEIPSFEDIEIRMQDYKNRQNSTMPVGSAEQDVSEWADLTLDNHLEQVQSLYQYLLKEGVAKEVARFILPECTTSVMYALNTVRGWIHYLDVRTGNGTQKEHIAVAEAIKPLFIAKLPEVSKGLGWV